MSDKRNAQYVVGTAGTPVTLTGSYVAGSQITINNEYQLVLDVAYTMGTSETANSLQLKVEFSNEQDVSNWYQQVVTATSTGTTTITKHEYTLAATGSAGTYDRFHLPMPLDGQFVRVSVKETGIATNGGSCTVIAITSKEQRG